MAEQTGAALYVYHAIAIERHAKRERAGVSEAAGEGDGVRRANWWVHTNSKSILCFSDATSTAIAVGRDVFRPDSRTFVELLMRIQSKSLVFVSTATATDVPDMSLTDSPPDPNDTMLSHFLIATWAKVCQALGEEFEPYLPVVMQPLLRVAGSKADISIYGTFV